MYTVGPGPVGKCTGKCTLEGSVQGGFQCTLPRTFTYRAWPYSVHCPFSLNNLIYRAKVQDYLFSFVFEKHKDFFHIVFEVIAH